MKRQFCDCHGQRQPATAEALKRRKCAVNVQDDQPYACTAINGKRCPSTPTHNNTTDTCDIREIDAALPIGNTARPAADAYIPPRDKPFIRGKEGEQETIHLKASTHGKEYNTSSPALLGIDTGTSLSSRLHDPPGALPLALAHSSPSFSQIIDGLRLTELERDMLESFLDLAAPVDASQVVKDDAQNPGGSHNVDVEIVLARAKQNEEYATEIAGVYPCLLVPASPFSDVEDFLNLEETIQHEHEHEHKPEHKPSSPSADRPSTFSQDGDAPEVAALAPLAS